MSSQQHHVIKVTSNGGIFRELKTPGTIIDTISKKSLQVQSMIWDTGATGTCIREDIARALNLTPVGVTNMTTASGVGVSNVYLVDILFSHGVQIQHLRVCGANLGPNTEVLIGMDIIGMGDFTVQNNGGSTEFAFCIPPFKNKYDMIEKANTINAKLARKYIK